MSVNFEILKRVLSCAVFNGFLNSVFWAIVAQIFISISPPSGFWGDTSKFFMLVSILMGIISGCIVGSLIGYLNRTSIESAFIAAGLYIGYSLFMTSLGRLPSKSEIISYILSILIPAILLALASGITAKIFNGALTQTKL